MSVFKGAIKTNKRKKENVPMSGCARRIRTFDLRLMRATSYQLLHCAIFKSSLTTCSGRWEREEIIRLQQFLLVEIILRHELKYNQIT